MLLSLSVVNSTQTHAIYRIPSIFWCFIILFNVGSIWSMSSTGMLLPHVHNNGECDGIRRVIYLEMVKFVKNETIIGELDSAAEYRPNGLDLTWRFCMHLATPPDQITLTIRLIVYFALFREIEDLFGFSRIGKCAAEKNSWIFYGSRSRRPMPSVGKIKSNCPFHWHNFGQWLVPD